MPHQRVMMTGRQYAALALVMVLIAAQVGVQLAGGPLWVVAILALLVMLALGLCVLVVVLPLARNYFDDER